MRRGVETCAAAVCVEDRSQRSSYRSLAIRAADMDAAKCVVWITDPLEQLLRSFETPPDTPGKPREQLACQLFVGEIASFLHRCRFPPARVDRAYGAAGAQSSSSSRGGRQ